MLLHKRQLSAFVRDCYPLRLGLKVGVRLLAPRQCVGAVGVVFNQAGQVLLVEHVFRTDFPWGLPGGWIARGENPAQAVHRELREELALEVDVKRLLLCEPVGLVAKSTHPVHLGLAFYCRVTAGVGVLTPEVLGFEWVEPGRITRELAPFQLKAVRLGAEFFENETERS